MVKNVVFQALDWLSDKTPFVSNLIYAVGEDEWVFDRIYSRLLQLLQIQNDEYSTTHIHSDDSSPEAIVDALRSGSLLNTGKRLVFIRGVPSAKQSKNREVLTKYLNGALDDSLYIVWLLPDFDPYKKPRLWPYKEITPDIVIRFDERSDELMLKWAKFLAQEMNITLSTKSYQLLAVSSKYPYEINSYLNQISVWAAPTGFVDDEVINKLALGEVESITEEVAFFLIKGDEKKMMKSFYKLDQQLLLKNATSIVWQLSAILLETWFTITKSESTEKRWSPYFRIMNEIEKNKKNITEYAVWSTLNDLASLDIALKSTGSFQQGARLITQTLLPAVKRFQYGTKPNS